MEWQLPAETRLELALQTRTRQIREVAWEQQVRAQPSWLNRAFGVVLARARPSRRPASLRHHASAARRGLAGLLASVLLFSAAATPAFGEWSPGAASTKVTPARTLWTTLVVARACTDDDGPYDR
jgi:hypothetical protein